MKAFLTIAFVFSILVAIGQSKNAYIRISPRDPRYLEFSDGTPYIPIGINLIGMGRQETEKGLAQVKDALQKLSKNKGNYFRLWFSDSLFCYGVVTLLNMDNRIAVKPNRRL